MSTGDFTKPERARTASCDTGGGYFDKRSSCLMKSTATRLALCLAILLMALSPAAQADTWNKKTYMTFSDAVELPGGVILPAGKYVFKLADSLSNRHIVQVFSEDEKKVHA